MNREPKPFYRGRLPHLQPEYGTFFITTNLQGAMPRRALIELRNKYLNDKESFNRELSSFDVEKLRRIERWYFSQYDKLLEGNRHGPHYLKEPAIAEIVKSQLHRFDNHFYTLEAYCIMSNHMHLLIDTSSQLYQTGSLTEYVELDRIMKRIKGPSARYANQVLGRSGQFWQRESYDHLIRNSKDYEHCLTYILNNPVKAGLVEKWEDWPHTYCNRQILFAP